MARPECSPVPVQESRGRLVAPAQMNSFGPTPYQFALPMSVSPSAIWATRTVWPFVFTATGADSDCGQLRVVVGSITVTSHADASGASVTAGAMAVVTAVR